MNTQAVIKQIADKVIAAMETAQASDFTKPWITLGSHRNIAGHQFRGCNKISTSLAGFADPRWATFLQIQEKGWRVKKGAKSTPIFYWSIKDKQDPEDEDAKYIFAKVTHAFNAEQIDGIPELEVLKAKEPFEVVEAAEEIVDAMVSDGLRIEHEGDSAFYQPALDKIVMPSEKLFPNREAMLAVQLHEICHSTGHKKRANRDLSGRMGSPSYSYEELIAELGGMMLYSYTGLTPSEHQVRQSAAYMKGWAEVLKQDPSKIMKAASAAQKAVAYIEERLPRPVVEEETTARHVVRLAM